jgi:hypothetical protein
MNTRVLLVCLAFLGLLNLQRSSAGTLSESLQARNTPAAGLVDEVKELFPDTHLDQPQKRLVVHAARNSLAGVHVMVTGLRAAEAVRFAVSNASGKPVMDARWFRLIDVPVAENTGLDRNTEKYSNKINPYVIRRAPFRVYDPLLPVTSPVTADSSLALRLELPVDSSAIPGEHSYRITIGYNGVEQNLEFVVVVHRATLPPGNHPSIAYINWINLDNICSAHGVEKWSEPFWEMLAKYTQMMYRGRQNAFWFLWTDYFTFDSSANVSSFRRDRLERYIRLFLNTGFTTIHGAPMVGRRNWFCDDMLLGIQAADGKEVDPVSPKGKSMLSQMAVRVIAMMKENNWDGMWLQGIFDEPAEEFVDRYKVLVDLFRNLKPDIKILEATITTKVAGLVNVWCPQVHEFQANQEFFEKRRAVGDRVWVYTCLAPGGPWLNRLLDMERLRQVYIGWACSKYNLQGFLHWGLNFHTPKPFEELVRFHMEGQYLPAGDSHILYPIREGPLSSHRFEAHRIGIEDFELLDQLKAHDSTRAVEIIGSVVQGFDKYNTDVAAYRAAKKALLEAVDTFSGN